MRDGGKMLAPVLDPFYGVPELTRRISNQKILRIKLPACAKTTPDVELHIVHCHLRQAHHCSKCAAIEEGKLRRTGHAKPPGSSIPLRDQPACFHGHGREPLYLEAFPPAIRGRAERGVDVA